MGHSLFIFPYSVKAGSFRRGKIIASNRISGNPGVGDARRKTLSADYTDFTDSIIPHAKAPSREEYIHHDTTNQKYFLDAIYRINRIRYSHRGKRGSQRIDRPDRKIKEQIQKKLDAGLRRHDKERRREMGGPGFRRLFT
jgi:hypothetical protein